MRRGLYIAIEGAAGVGKTTVIEQVAKQLRAARLPVRVVQQNDLELENIRQLLENGVTCLTEDSRLKTIVTGYYGTGELASREEPDIPSGGATEIAPDVVLVLDAPVTTLKERYQRRYGAERLANLDEALLERVRAGYLWEAKQRGLPVVYATEGADGVFQAVWKHLASLFDTSPDLEQSTKPQSIGELLATMRDNLAAVSAPNTTAPENQAGINTQLDKLAQLDAKAQPAYYTPANLPKALAITYRTGLELILKNRAKILQALPESNKDLSRLTLPLACLYTSPAELTLPQGKLADIAQETLQTTYSSGEPVTLASFYPRNEFSLVPELLYRFSSLPFTDLVRQADALPYEQKATVLTTAIQEGLAINSSYSWDTVCSYADMLALRRYGVQLEHQELSPRFGYGVPAAIEAAGMADTYEACFDTSMELFSELQAGGQAQAAQYAVLFGHKQRAKITLTISQLVNVRKVIPKGTELQSLISKLTETIADIHPILADSLTNPKDSTPELAPKQPLHRKRTRVAKKAKRPKA